MPQDVSDRIKDEEASAFANEQSCQDKGMFVWEDRRIIRKSETVMSIRQSKRISQQGKDLHFLLDLKSEEQFFQGFEWVMFL